MNPQEKNAYIKRMQQIVYNTARANGLGDVVSKLIVSQATHESGNFSSSLFKRANNAFGMTIPRKRKSPYITGSAGQQPDGPGNYAKYDSLQDSVLDLIHWHKYNRTDWTKIEGPATYAAYLKSKGYYGDTQQNYQSRLYEYFKGLSWLQYTPVAGVLLFIVIAYIILSKS